MDAAAETQTIFRIPAENLPKFEAQIAKLSRRSEKLVGLPIKPFVFGYEDKKLSDGRLHRVFEVMLTAETPVIDGWTFVARIDHSQEAGNLLRAVPNLGVAIPEHFRQAEPCCDHCQVRRYRRDTFLLHHAETGAFKQVGHTCLIDFFGHDVSRVAKYAEILGYAEACARGGEQFVGGDLRFIEVEAFLHHCAAAVRVEGRFVSRKTAMNSVDEVLPTASRAHHTMFPTPRRPVPEDERPTDADKALAAEALAWALALGDQPQLSDYEHNLLVIARSPMMEYRAEGLAASIIGSYLRRQETGKGLEVIATLEAHLDRLGEKDRAFAASLIQSVKARGTASDSQRHWLEELAKRATKTEDKVGDISGIVKLINDAKLQRPAILLAMPDGTGMKVSKAGEESRNPGCLYVKATNGSYLGKITPSGAFEGTAAAKDNLTNVLASLQAFAADPAGVAAAYGKKTGVCCFCGRPLADARSTEVGYGKVCASRFGLAWGKK